MRFQIITKLLLSVAIQVPSLRFCYERLPYPFFAWVALVVLNYVLFSVLNIDSVKKIYNHQLFTWTVFIILISAVLVLYPIIDQNFLSTADDGFRQAISTFLVGNPLYQIPLFDQYKIPLSPGPGWLLINLPFGMVYYAYPLLNVFWGILAYWRIRNSVGIDNSNIFMLLVLFNPITAELLLNGHDLLAVSFTLVFITQLSVTKPPSYMLIILLAVLITSRIIYLAFPVGLAIAFWPKFGIKSLKWLLAIPIAIIVHLPFLLQSDFYQPLHLITHRGAERQSILIVALIVGFIAVMVYLYLFKGKSKYVSEVMFVAVVMFIIHTTIALNELIAIDFKFADWEAANYWLIGSIFLMYAYAHNERKRTLNLI